MSNYIPHTQEEIKQMLETIGINSIDELFKDITTEFSPKSFNLPEGLSEFEVIEKLKKLSNKNKIDLISFLGAGFYDHYIPSAVDALSNRSDFYTAYTPYQPECSQGWLQAIYEFQTSICELVNMEVSNASLYDGGTALYEAIHLAVQVTGKNKIILDSGINPIYKKMLQTYSSNLDIIEIPVVYEQTNREKIYQYLNDKTAAVVLQNPNFFGIIDNYKDIVEKAHKHQALVIQYVYPISLGILKTPGEIGVDIVIGEGQSLGIPLSFGGPYLGFIATKKAYVRKLPGRIVGKTIDIDGKTGFTLTLQAREQHIRREKATSNICSNEALCSLRAVIYLSLLGKNGIKELAKLNYEKSEFAKNIISEIPNVKINKELFTFNEFVVSLPIDASIVVNKMFDQGFICGLPLSRFYKNMENLLLINVTEKKTEEEIIKLKENLELILCN